MKIDVDLERETTLENYSGMITVVRRDGNSTRLVDHAIQILFSGKVCVVLDHHDLGRNKLANRALFAKIIQRLNNEHHWTEIIVDGLLFEIVLKSSSKDFQYEK